MISRRVSRRVLVSFALGAAVLCAHAGMNVVWAGYIQHTVSTVGALTSATQKAAPDGTTPNTRTTIGLGEKVDLTLDSSLWADTDENTTTGAIENDTIGWRVWAAAGAGTISPTGVTFSDTTTLTASFDPGIVAVVVHVYDSQTKFNDAYIQRDKVFTVIKPTGETTADNGWNGRIARFESTLTPLSVCFGAISVTEKDGAGSADGCWFMGSTQTKYEALTGGTWDVSDMNVWGDDNLAWGGGDITYYRANPAGAVRAPCSTSIAQEMHVVEGTSGKYTQGNLVLTIGAATLSATRNGTTMNRAWP